MSTSNKLPPYVMRGTDTDLDFFEENMFTKAAAASDKNVEILPDFNPLPAVGTNDYPTMALPDRPSNSFLARVTEKNRGHRRSKKKKKRNNNKFLNQHQVEAKAGVVEISQSRNDISKIEKEVEMDLNDIKKLAVRKRPSPFSSSPGLLEQRNSYLDLVAIARVRESCDDLSLEEENDQSTNADMVKVQAEYISALESELKRAKVSSALKSRSLKLKVERVQRLLALKDQQIARKDLKLFSLQTNVLNLETEIGQKDDIIDIQGQYIEKLEEENATQAESLKNIQITPANYYEIADDVFTDCSSFSTML